MSEASQRLRRRMAKELRNHSAEEFVRCQRMIDDIQRNEPISGRGSTEYGIYWETVNRQMKYIGRSIIDNLASITPQFIRSTFFYNREPEEYNSDIQEPRHYRWGNSYDIDFDEKAEKEIERSVETRIWKK